MSKLLHKQLKVFSTFAFLILACSIPSYYVAIRYIGQNELDEQNHALKQQIETGFQHAGFEDSTRTQFIDQWNNMQPGLWLDPKPARHLLSDSVYTISKKIIEHGEPETERFRCLRSSIQLGKESHALRIETNMEDADDTIWSISVLTFAFFFLLVLGFVFLNKFLSEKLWKPFNVTLAKLSVFNLNKDQKIHLEPSGVDEFDELNRVVARLIEKNVGAFKAQKKFIENASHELQTPLAVLKSKIELLFQHPSLNKDLSDQIAAIQLPLSRLSRLNKNLLLLAKIENSQFEERSPLDVVEVVNNGLEMLSDYCLDKALALDVQIDVEHLLLNSNRVLLETLVNNLLINAIQHTAQGGEVQVHVHARTLLIANSGQQALPESSLFERFNNATVKDGGSGLGLSIVHEICLHHPWQLSYAFEENKHQFKVQF